MPVFQVALDPLAKIVTIQADGDALPTGAKKVGTFRHDNVADLLGPVINHVVYHHVRDILYHTSNKPAAGPGFWPENITDMAAYDILQDVTANVTAIVVAPKTVSLSLAGTKTRQLAVTFTPAEPTNKDVTYTSATPAIATVSNTGLITAVAVGTVTITATSADGAKKDTVAVTVTA